VSRYQKGKTNLDLTGARDNEWQWHQLGRMQVCISLQTDNHSSTPPLSFLQAGCPSCRPTNSVKALKAHGSDKSLYYSLRIIVNDLELLDGLYCLTTGVAVNVKLMMIVAVHEMCKKESL